MGNSSAAVVTRGWARVRPGSRAHWAQFGPIGPDWAHLGPGLGPARVPGPLGPIWAHWGRFGPIGPSLGPFGTGPGSIPGPREFYKIRVFLKKCNKTNKNVSKVEENGKNGN